MARPSMSGQVGCADVDTNVAFGFVRNHLSSVSPLSGDLIDAQV